MTDISSTKKLVFIHQLTPMQMKIQDSSVFGGLSQIGAGIGAQSFASTIEDFEALYLRHLTSLIP